MFPQRARISSSNQLPLEDNLNLVFVKVCAALRETALHVPSVQNEKHIIRTSNKMPTRWLVLKPKTKAHRQRLSHNYLELKIVSTDMKSMIIKINIGN